VSLDAILFHVFGGLALLSAIVVVAQRNPVYSAFGLIVNLVSLAALFGLLGATFIAVLQVIVYAGAIMVLFLFVLMLLNVKAEEPAEARGGRTLKAVAAALGALLAAQVGVVLVRVAPDPAGMPAEFDASARVVARLLFSPQYSYAFEATSILILAALVGAIALAGRDHITGKDF
jgi:NADH-quinone oxidoreductase subunit J